MLNHLITSGLPPSGSLELGMKILTPQCGVPIQRAYIQFLFIPIKPFWVLFRGSVLPHAAFDPLHPF